MEFCIRNLNIINIKTKIYEKSHFIYLKQNMLVASTGKVLARKSLSMWSKYSFSGILSCLFHLWVLWFVQNDHKKDPIYRNIQIFIHFPHGPLLILYFYHSLRKSSSFCFCFKDLFILEGGGREGQRKRESISSRLRAEQGARSGARSHGPEDHNLSREQESDGSLTQEATQEPQESLSFCFFNSWFI